MQAEGNIDPVSTALLSMIDFYPHEVVKSQPDDECPTCKEPYRLNEIGHCRAIRLKQCGHVFGDLCLEHWWRIQEDRCLMCNHDLAHTEFSVEHPTRAQQQLIAEAGDLMERAAYLVFEEESLYGRVSQWLSNRSHAIMFPGDTWNKSFEALAYNRMTEGHRSHVRKNFSKILTRNLILGGSVLSIHYTVASLLPFLIWRLMVSKWPLLRPTFILLLIGTMHIPLPILIPVS